MFDPNAFMTEAPGTALDTRYDVIKEGEYLMSPDPDSVKVTAMTSNKPEHAGKSWPQLTIMWNILDESEKQRLGRDKLQVRQQFLLDTNTSGGLDWGKGKNVRLGQIFEALGMNDGTGTIEKIKNGGIVLGRVSVTAKEGDPDTKYANVARVAKKS
jgi:hypothetical protein